MSAHNTVRRLTLVALATLGVTGTGLAIAVAPSMAALEYPKTPSSVFGEPCTSTPCGNSQFSTPVGVAVDDASEDVYVVDQGNDRVEYFTSEGTYIGEFNGSAAPTGKFEAPGDIAVDNSTDAAKGDVYVIDAGAHNVIDVFSSTGTYLSQIIGTPSPFPGKLRGVAVDASGNVWVYESENNVDEFSDTGSFDESFNTGIEGHSSPGFAVDSNSNVYVIPRAGGGVRKFNSAGTFLEFVGEGCALAPCTLAEGVALAVNQSTNNVFVDTESNIQEFGPLGVQDEFGSGSISSSEGIAVNDTTGTFYASESGADTVAIFDAIVSREVSTEGTSEVTATSAKLEGTVNPAGEPVTRCEFEYVAASEYESDAPEPYAKGKSAPCEEPDAAEIGKGTAPVPVKADIKDLTPETTYHYRLVAKWASGTTPIAGKDMTFTTHPAVEGVLTLPATSVTIATAMLNGSLEPNGFDAHWWFEYGLSESYGTRTPTEDAGSATAEVKNVEKTLSGLEPNAIYHFRLAAENEDGITYGLDETFMTLPSAPLLTLGEPSSLTDSSVTLEGAINPQGAYTTYQFNYGEATPHGKSAPESPAAFAGSNSNEPISVSLTGLTPNTTYHYQLVATAANEGGSTAAESPVETFTTPKATPPWVSTDPATQIESTSATLAGSVTPPGAPTTYHFEYVAAGEYDPQAPDPYSAGGVAPEPEASAGSGTGAEQETVDLTGLQPGTTYHYRIVATATNLVPSTVAAGPDQTFATPPEAGAAQTGNPFSPGQSTLSSLPTIPLLSTPIFPPPPTETTATPKPATRAEKLAKALKQCKKDKRKKKRVACEKQAHRKYASKPKAKK